jgi:hypothetical protein
MRQDAGVQHVGVGQHEARLLADGGTVLLRRVAIVNGSGQVRRLGDGEAEAFQRVELVLGQGLGGEEIQRARLRIFRQRRQDGQVVGQGLAAGRARGENDVSAAAGMGPGLGLMRIKGMDARRDQGLFDGSRQVGRQGNGGGGSAGRVRQAAK